jgi:hypothetical protein
MSKIPSTIRNSGRYYFRRRFRLENGSDFNVIIPLLTCKAQEARGRAVALAAQFEKLKRGMDDYYDLSSGLDPVLVKRFFQEKLRSCLRKLISEFHDPKSNPEFLVSMHRSYASAYDISQRPGNRIELTMQDRERLAKEGHDSNAIEDVACDLHRAFSKDTVDRERLEDWALNKNIEPTAPVVGRMTQIHLQAKSEAHRLASFYLEEEVQSSFDQENFLISKQRNAGEAIPTGTTWAANAPQSIAIPEPASTPTTATDIPLAVFDPRRFSEVIGEILEKASRRKRWNGGLHQYERVLLTFAWITGDKQLGNYNHLDVEKFADGLPSMPKDFRPKQYMHRDFQEVRKEFSTLA